LFVSKSDFRSHSTLTLVTRTVAWSSTDAFVRSFLHLHLLLFVAILSLSLSLRLLTTDDRDDVMTIRVARCSATLSLRPTGTDSAVQEVDPSRETETLKTKARGARASRVSSAPFPLSPFFSLFPARNPHHLSLPRSLSLSRFSPLFSHRDLSFRRQARATTLSFVLPLRLTATNCDCDCRSRRAAMCRTPAIRASDWPPASRGTRPPLPTIGPGA